MIPFKQTLIFLVTLLPLCTSIAIQLLPNQQRCFQLQGSSQYTIQFIIAGYQEQNINFSISSQSAVILEKSDIKDYKDNVRFGEGPHKLCFNITDDYAKMLIIDFFDTNDLVKTLITKKDLSQVGTVLREAYTELKNVYRNQQFQIERDKTHKELLEQTEGKIKYTGIFKVGMLLGSALVQVWIMKRFFNSRSRDYQSVST